MRCRCVSAARGDPFSAPPALRAKKVHGTGTVADDSPMTPAIFLSAGRFSAPPDVVGNKRRFHLAAPRNRNRFPARCMKEGP